MIIVVGSLSFDFIMNFPGRFSDHILPDKIHILNLSFLTEKLHKNFGGTAGNIAYNLALLKNKVSILASAGKDFNVYQKFLNQAGVNTKYVKKYLTDFTSNYFAVVDKLDNQIGGFYAGVMTQAAKLSLNNIKDPISFVIISPTVPEAMIKLAVECQRLKIPYLFDPGMQLPRLTKEQLLQGISGAKILIGNDYEVSLMQKKLNFTSRMLKSKVDILITTLAEKGSFIEAKNPPAGGKKIIVASAKPAKVLDPVGAGDAYRAGFMAGFMRKFSLKTCGQMGATAAVYTVEKYGTTTHQFTTKEFCARYKKNFGEELKLDQFDQLDQ